MSVIGFVGSVFSPWYRWSGRKDPENHVCLNVATYGPGGRFTMTDRGRPALRRTADRLQIGPSAMHWNGRELAVEVNEISALPMVSRVQGMITLTPEALTRVEARLTPDGSHTWRPFAPIARIKVDLSQGQKWEGHGYWDANFGTAALEADFKFWTWGRFPLADRTVCFYDATRRDGSTLALGVEVRRDGTVEEIAPPPLVPFRRSLWTVRRETRADPGFQPRQRMNLLDAPFYSRSLVETRIGGEVTTGVHEALDLVRYRQPWLKPMIAVRVPRRRDWVFGEGEG